MNLHHFYFQSQQNVRTSGMRLRYGQALFNLLAEVRPELAEQIRGTDKDPFHMNGPADNPAKWDSFINFIETNWYKKS